MCVRPVSSDMLAQNSPQSRCVVCRIFISKGNENERRVYDHKTDTSRRYKNEEKKKTVSDYSDYFMCVPINGYAVRHYKDERDLRV